MLMKGDGVMSPVGFDLRVCDAALSLNVAVGRLMSPPGAVMVRRTSATVVVDVGLLR